MSRDVVKTEVKQGYVISIYIYVCTNVCTPSNKEFKGNIL